jgi:hypothetical protein
MAKQRRRRGHIQLRSNGTFRAYVYAGRDPITKQPRYLSETVKTYGEAEKALTRLLAQVDRERSPTTSGTVGYLLSRWLGVTDLELTTRDWYEGYIRRNLLPALWDVALRKLDTETLDRFYAHLRAHGGRPAGVADGRAGRGGGWSVKDILVHVTTWEAEALRHLPTVIAGGRPPRYAEQGGIDAFNARSTEAGRRRPLHEVLRRQAETHARLVEFIRTQPPGTFGGDSRAWRRLRLDTYGHYPEHTAAIREWRERLPA